MEKKWSRLSSWQMGSMSFFIFKYFEQRMKVRLVEDCAEVALTCVPELLVEFVADLISIKAPGDVQLVSFLHGFMGRVDVHGALDLTK